MFLKSVYRAPKRPCRTLRYPSKYQTEVFKSAEDKLNNIARFSLLYHDDYKGAIQYTQKHLEHVFKVFFGNLNYYNRTRDRVSGFRCAISISCRGIENTFEGLLRYRYITIGNSVNPFFCVFKAFAFLVDFLCELQATFYYFNRAPFGCSCAKYITAVISMIAHTKHIALSFILVYVHFACHANGIKHIHIVFPKIRGLKHLFGRIVPPKRL